MEKAIEWCNDGSKGRMYNGTYILCKNEKDLWRVMKEFGRQAPICLKIYINKNFVGFWDLNPSSLSLSLSQSLLPSLYLSLLPSASLFLSLSQLGIL